MNEVVARRALLLDQIGAVFRARGYEGATLTALSAATGLGKASLYHHFPGGKAEMADVLLREAVADLQRLAFARLSGSEPPAVRVQRFLAGFADYLERNGGTCLLGVLVSGSVRGTHGEQISAQFRAWQEHLARVLEETGQKPKRAARTAAEMLNAIYGAQVVAKLNGDSRHLRRSFKRLIRTAARLA